MNKYLLTSALMASLFLSACNDDGGKENGEAAITTANVEATTSITYENDVYDFGAITQGEKVTKEFKFTNTGDADLVIVSAKGSCGCTVPEYPKEPIAPGTSGVITVVFNSEGKKGKQHKRVSIVANTEPATTAITLKGDVIVPEAVGADSTDTQVETEL